MISNSNAVKCLKRGCTFDPPPLPRLGGKLAGESADLSLLYHSITAAFTSASSMSNPKILSRAASQVVWRRYCPTSTALLALVLSLFFPQNNRTLRIALLTYRSRGTEVKADAEVSELPLLDRKANYNKQPNELLEYELFTLRSNRSWNIKYKVTVPVRPALRFVPDWWDDSDSMQFLLWGLPTSLLFTLTNS